MHHRAQIADPGSVAAHWTLEATFRADAPDGTVAAHGGTLFGYCLTLENGRPVFTVVGQKRQSRVTVDENVVGKWTSVRANIASQTLSLSINGAAPVSARLGRIAKDPNDGLQIGDD